MVSTNTTKRMGVELPKVLSIATRSLPPCNRGYQCLQDIMSVLAMALLQSDFWLFPLYGMKTDQKQTRHCTELVPTYVQVGRQQR